MQKPLLVLAISALATFTMGWMAHRLYTQSQIVDTSDVVHTVTLPNPQPVNIIAPDTTKKAEQGSDALYHQAAFKEVQPKKKLVNGTPDTLLNDEIDIIWKHPDGTVEVKRKFKMASSFKDFPVTKKYNSKLKGSLDFSTCSSGDLYRKEIKQALKKGVVFAGQYAVAKIFSDSTYSLVLADLKTGKVYSGPHAISGYSYRAESRLLIVNPPGKDGLYTPCEVCAPALYTWTGKSFTKLQ